MNQDASIRPIRGEAQDVEPPEVAVDRRLRLTEHGKEAQ